MAVIKQKKKSGFTPPTEPASPRRQFFNFDKPEPAKKKRCDWKGCHHTAAISIGGEVGLCTYHHSEYISNDNKIEKG